MRPFQYTAAPSPASATTTMQANPEAKYLAGGTNLLDLMKEEVERPAQLVDISGLKDVSITAIASGANKGGVSISGFGKNTEAANHPLIRMNYPMLSQAILSAATEQIRNMATNGGNLNQRTRCSYFYETGLPCNKREPGTGCSALEGINRNHAIFGWSEKCVATHPSDMCVALAALNSVVRVRSANGNERLIPFTDYHRLPGDMPQKDNILEHGDLVVALEIPPNNFATSSYYLKVRDRASYAFALVSVAAGIVTTNNRIDEARIAMGGVAHKPWRALEAEKYLKGKAATEANFSAAAEREMAKARPLEHNQFKVELGKKAIVRALHQAMQGATN
ncbi:FAD binding domain-containing protein [Pontibacter sp. CAU 1760]